MLVTLENFSSIISELESGGEYGLDTETYGLSHDDGLFSIQIAHEGKAYYFNFYSGSDHLGAMPPENTILGEEHLEKLFLVLDNPTSIFYIHNAKFDLAKLEKEGLFVRNPVCTMVLARIEMNIHMNYSLDACLKRLGRAKNDLVKKHIQKHKLFTKVEVKGKKAPEKKLHYQLVPMDMMVKYGCDDALDVLYLGKELMKRIRNKNKTSSSSVSQRLDTVYHNEIRLTETCLKMERLGIKIDREYTKWGMEYESASAERTRKEITSLVGCDYVAGPKWLRNAFDKLNEPYSINPETGNPIFNKDALNKMETPLANLVKKLRHQEQYCQTYYSSFLHLADRDGIIRANIKQAGTDTGRFSYSSPNLQNLPKESSDREDVPYVRKCIVPREGYAFVAIDYSQMEYRLMADYAGQMDLIEEVMAGKDLHTATAEMMGVDRKAAKTINFMLLYGGGAAKLATALDITEAEAKGMKELYFAKLPKVEEFIASVKSTAQRRKYIVNWLGRRCYLPNREALYIMPNHLIQGSGADVIKVAMNRIDDVDFKVRMLVNVHDELLFEVPEDSLDEVNTIKEIMEDAYVPMNGMKMACDIEHSHKSWGHMKEGLPWQD